MVDICLPSPSHASRRSHASQQPLHHNNNPQYQSSSSGGGGKRHYVHPEQARDSSNSSPSSQYGLNGGNNGGWRVDGPNQGIGTRSCFSIFGSSHRKMLQTPSHSSSQMSHDSQPLVRQQQLQEQQKQDEFAMTWEAFHQNQFDRQASAQWDYNNKDSATSGTGVTTDNNKNNNHTTTTTTSTSNQPPQDNNNNSKTATADGFSLLLQPPKPTDRSHKQRLRLEQEKRKAGVYEGELEPEGVRGQEASVVIGPQHANHIPQFHPSNNAAATAGLRNFDSNAPQPPTTQLRPISIRQLETIAEMSESRASESRASADSVQSWGSQSPNHRGAPSATQQSSSTVLPLRPGSISPRRHYNGIAIVSPHSQQSGRISVASSKSGRHSANSARSRDPPATKSFESSSTDSDEDIERMMADFLGNQYNSNGAPQRRASPNSQTNGAIMKRDYPNPLPITHTNEPQRMIDSIMSTTSNSRNTPNSLQSARTATPNSQQQQQQPPFDTSSNSSSRQATPQTRPIHISASQSQQSQSSSRVIPITTTTPENTRPPLSPNRPSQQQQQQQLPIRRGIAPILAPEHDSHRIAVTTVTSSSSSEQQLSPSRRNHAQSQRNNLPAQNQHSSDPYGFQSPPPQDPPPYQQQQHAATTLLSPPDPTPIRNNIHNNNTSVATTSIGAQSPTTNDHPPDQPPPLPIPPIHPQHSHLSPGQSVDAWNALALQHVQSGEYDMALAAFQHVLRAYKLQYGNVHPLVASAYHNLGTVHAKRAQLLLDDTLHQRHCRAQSLQCFQSAARAARDSLGRDHPNVAVSLVRIGFLLLQARQYNNAVITFQEALRIRQVHYGPHHALVANLYNNLGVCYMHLGQFAHGRDLLQHALQIQRTLLEQAQNETEEQEEKKEGSTSPTSTQPSTANQSLELADTLFNIGGLALEWIRRQGPDVRHAQDAEAAFEEAMELRKSVLGPKDPMVLQVKSLLDMARSIPRPKSPGRRVAAGNSKPTRGNGNVNYQPSSTLPDPMGSSPATARKGDRDTSVSPPRSRASSARDYPYNRNNNGSGDSADLAAPYRLNHTANNNGMNSPPRSLASSSQQTSPPRSSASSPLRYNKHADYLEPPPKVNHQHRSLLDHTDNDGRPEKPRHAASSPTMNSQAGRQSFASSTASTVKVSPGRRTKTTETTKRFVVEESKAVSVFRKDTHVPYSSASNSSSNNNNAKNTTTKPRQPPPVMEVTVSQDEDDDGLYDPAALPQPPTQTNIFISPHYVPQMSPHKVNGQDGDSSSPTASSYSGVPVSAPRASLLEANNGGGVVKSYSYDAEESCLLSDGRGATPSQDGYDALQSLPPNSPSREKAITDKGGRKIMVVRPYRSSPVNNSNGNNNNRDSVTSPTSGVVSSNSRKSPDGETIEATSSGLYSSDLEYSSKTSSYTRDARHSERSATLDRARALLQANREYMDSPQVQLNGTPHYMSNVHSPDRVKQRLFKQKNDANAPVENTLDEDLEDGLAPLGMGDTDRDSTNKTYFQKGMLVNRPREHLREIYEEGSRLLKLHQYQEAAECFEVILQCQRRQFGPFHEDVASALHNCGLAHLRAGGHQKALKCFEEAVRIRKGTLGREHPHVAASLVKCGITFLLLHRFEEALWSFREALSIRKHSLGTLHPSTARIYNNIGCVHVEFNELREARRAFEGALDIQRNALCHDPESGPVRFGAAATLCNLGYLYRYRGMHERASQVLREAADIQEDILGATHPTVLSTLDSLAEALINSGQSVDAYKTQEVILQRFRSTESPGSRRLIRAEAGLKYKMSRAAKAMNDRENQISNLQQALQSVRSLDEKTEAARNQAESLEKRILSDLREARESMEANELKWV